MPSKVSSRDKALAAGDFYLKVVIDDPGSDGTSLIAGCTLRGTVLVSAPPPDTNRAGEVSSGGAWSVRSLRVQLEGTEEHHAHGGKQRHPDPTVHLWRTVTLVGPRPREELEAARLQATKEASFAREATRGAPLTGLVLSLHGSDDAGTAGGSGAAAAASTVDFELSAPAAALRMTPGETARVPFAVKLPPWLPPSLAYRIGTKAHGSIEYSARAFLDAALEQSAAGSPDPQTAATATGSGVVLRHGEWSSNPATLTLRLALPRRQLLQCQERAGIKPLFTQHWRFRVPSRNVLSKLLSSGKATVGSIDVSVRYLSSTALLLTDPDDRASAALRERWVNGLLGAASEADGSNNNTGGSGTPAQPGSPNRQQGAAADTTVTGTVVAGSPVPRNRQSPTTSGGGFPRTTRPQAQQQPLHETFPVGELRLRVRIQNGDPAAGEKTLGKMRDITCVRIALVEEVMILHRSAAAAATRKAKGSGGASNPHGTATTSHSTTSATTTTIDDPSALFVSPSMQLGYQDCTQTIKPGTSQTFDVTIRLPPRFRRNAAMRSPKVAPPAAPGKGPGSDSDSDCDSDCADAASEGTGVHLRKRRKPLPPTSISTGTFSCLTYIKVSFPGETVFTEVAPEGRNVIVLAEAVDDTDAVPFLPMVAGV